MNSAEKKFSLFTGHMSFQIILLIRHFTNWIKHNLLTDNTLMKISQDVLVRCLVTVSNHNVKLATHFQNLVSDRPIFPALYMALFFFQHLSSLESQILESHWLISRLPALRIFPSRPEF